jgi:hypothetical protein
LQTAKPKDRIPARVNRSGKPHHVRTARKEHRRAKNPKTATSTNLCKNWRKSTAASRKISLTFCVSLLFLPLLVEQWHCPTPRSGADILFVDWLFFPQIYKLRSPPFGSAKDMMMLPSGLVRSTKRTVAGQINPFPHPN